MKESTIQSKVLTYLRSIGYVVNVMKASKSGVPDILACVNGRFIGIEMKTPATINDSSPLQILNKEWIVKAGGIAFVAVSLDDVKSKLALLQLLSILARFDYTT